MESKEDSFTLDNSAQQLYKQFAGLDETSRIIDNTSSSALIQLLSQEEKLLDYYRLLLAQATAHFVGILANSRFSILAKENEQKVKVLISTLKRIAKFPKFTGKIYCRLRGKQCPSGKIGSETYDYELSFGNFLLDFQVAQIVAEREKANGTAIYAKLMEAFNTLSAMNIFNFSLDIGTGSDEEYQQLETAIKHLMRFYAEERSPTRTVVNDEYGNPSINLTLLAATNKIPANSLQGLVDKIGTKLLAENPSEELNLFTTAYEVIFASKQNRERLKKLPIEVNNVQWLTQKLQKGQQQTTQAIQVSRFILAKYGSNPRMASEVISSINSGGYVDIHADVMSKRLACASDFLSQATESANEQVLQSEALQNIEDGLEQVPDSVYDKLTIQDGKVSTESKEGQKTSWSFHEKILGLLSFFKQRSTTKEKVRNIANRSVLFNSEDHAVIARNFRVSEKDAAHLLELLRGCFDDKGHFRRNFFEKNIPEFVRYESRVFEFLWHYLKELPLRYGRVAFLNALHLLVAKLTNPQDALNILLSDVFKHSSVITFSDRNGLILSNRLLRPATALGGGSDMELTPDEVLLVQKQLNQVMATQALQFCEEYQEQIIQKVRRITEALLLKSSSPEQEEIDMQPRFLLYLQRELVIFLSLTGGESALAIVQGVVQEFGNPDSDYYKDMRKKENLRHSLQLLQVAIRGLRRFGDSHTPGMIDSITCREKDFVNLWHDPSHRAYVKTVMERISKPD